MSQQFVINLHNPDIKTPPDDIIYTGLKDGNKLNVAITNNSGFALQFAAGAGQPDLLIKIAKTIIDEKGAEAITVQAPWQTDGIFTPDNDPDKNDKGEYYVVKLKMAASTALPFSNNGTVTVALGNIQPIAKGSATIIAYYDFGSGLIMNTAGQISVLGSSTDGKQLIGDTAYLKYTLMVNDGDDVNNIVATEAGKPVTAANAAENKIHLNFFFLNPDPGSDAGGTMGGLVPSWDTDHPPTFKIRFPYFNGNSPDPATADLTDDYQLNDPSYNEYTSAWNIMLSLDSQNPNILSNTWWTITPPVPGSDSAPFWLIQPTVANKYLFTGMSSGQGASGPFLDLYLSHIYSNLPISTTNPETQIILETYCFPGFNDASSPRPLFKEQSVQILCFSGQVNITPEAGTVLVLTWTTKNADHCFVSGDSVQLGANSYGTAYSKTISNANPLKSGYTLTAYDKQGVSKISNTIYVQWAADNNNTFPVSDEFIAPTAMDINFSPGGSTVYVAGGNNNADGAVCVSILNGQTLVTTPNPIILPNNENALNVKATADGSKILIAGLNVMGDTGKIYGYNTANPPQPLKGSPFICAAPCNWPNLYPMVLSKDQTQLIISNPFPSASQTPVKPFIEGINTSSFTVMPATGNPSSFTATNLGPVGLKINGDNIFFPAVDGVSPGGLGVMNRNTLTQVAGSPVSLRSDPNGIKYTPGPLVVSADGNTVTTLAQGYDTNNNWTRVFILCQVDIPTMKLTRRVQVFNGYGNTAMFPTTDIAYSVDEKYIFVFGLNYDASGNTDNQSLVSVFDASTLVELTWSPVAVPIASGGQTKTLIEQIIMSPDGGRIFALALDSSVSNNGRIYSFIPYFPGTLCKQPSSENDC